MEIEDIKSAMINEQGEAAIAHMARMVGLYHESLIESGVPDKLAAKITLHYAKATHEALILSGLQDMLRDTLDDDRV